MRRTSFVFAGCGGLLGAAGVAAAAAAAHLGGGQLLETAATFLMIHSAAVIAVATLAERAPRRGAIALLAADLLLIAGMILFCGDFAMRALAQHPLFPMAAPSGGTLLIAGWLLAGLGALVAATGRGRDGPK